LAFHSGREADHSPPSSAEVKEWVELYLHSPIRLHGVVLRESTGQLYLYLLTKQLPPWSRDLLEKLIVAELVKKLPAFYGTRRLITVFKRARH
jgi:hypothetical protein